MALDANLAIAASIPLLQQAVTTLEQGWRTNPGDWQLGWKLAEKLRQLGRLEEARAVYANVLAVNPACREVAWALSILSGEDLPDCPGPESAAVPFILRENYLEDDTLAAVWECILESGAQFTPSKVAKGLVTDTRNSTGLSGDKVSTFDSKVIAAVNSELSNSWSRLGVGMFDVRQTEIELVSHRDGEYYHVHRDSDVEGPFSERMITFVIYLFREPKQFEGGDLVLYDPAPKGPWSLSRYTRIVPRNNCLLMFPSSAFHQVTEVRCQDARQEYGRFAINGWLRRAPTESP